MTFFCGQSFHRKIIIIRGGGKYPHSLYVKKGPGEAQGISVTQASLVFRPRGPMSRVSAVTAVIE